MRFTCNPNHVTKILSQSDGSFEANFQDGLILSAGLTSGNHHRPAY